MTASLKTRTPTADVLDMRPVPRSAQYEHGFTLIELMVGIFILLVGILGVMSMADFASLNTRENNSRVAATNLAREIGEAARSVDYDLLTPAFVTAELRKRPGLQGSGDPWTLSRRNVSYAVTVSVCAFDDPRDGLAAAGNGPPNPCPTNGTGAGDTKERNGDDFRRVDVQLSWVRDARPRTLRQTEMIVNPAGSLGPRILKFDEPAAQIGPGGASVLSLPLNSQDADAVRWSVESVSTGDAAGGRRDWTVNWNLGLDPTTSSYVHDGTYLMSAQAYVRGIAGDARFISIPVNRNEPFAVANLVGGRNARWGGIVELRWSHSIEADVRRYKVYRINSDQSRTLVCERTRAQRPICSDTTAPLPSGALTYRVYALDLHDLASATSTERESANYAELRTGDTAGYTPQTPADLVVSVVNGAPSFEWTQSDLANVSFWRVYRRQGTHPGAPVLADRVTTTTDPRWVENDPKSGPVSYWFTAVSPTFNESPPTSSVIVNMP